MKIRREKSGRVFDFFNYGMMIVLSVSFLYPFWNLLIISMSSPGEANSFGFHLFPEEFNFRAYAQVFRTELIYSSFYNTFIRTILGCLITVAITIFAGYALAKRRLPFRNIITLFMLITIFFSGGLIPVYLNIRNLGLIDSVWALVLPGAANAWYIILARNFLMTFPEELEESALMDGASPFKVAIKIIFPLSMPIIAVIGLWASVYHWNAWFDALIYIRDKQKYVLQLLVYQIMLQESISRDTSLVIMHRDTTPQSIKATTIIITIAPILLVYPFAQKYFVKGIMVGSVKG